ncbi:MAG: B12-binding domain-containing radical SAM protein [Candidatus Thermoplasmatota archaeon]|nr:B12-binding domain-containing radical SAM protein [Candidatus Thermoplasmatota archaeon]
MTRFLLMYPPPEPFFIRATKVFYGLSPPLGLLYCAAVLEKEADKVTVLDFSAEPYRDEILTKALKGVDAVGMTVVSTSVHQAAHLVKVMKQHDPDLPVIIGGPHSTLLPEQSLEETHADISVQGDGETVILEIKKALEGETHLGEIPGVTYQTTTGIYHGPAAQGNDSLDHCVFPARHLVKHYVYGREYNPHLRAGDFTAMLTSRGCPYQCRFCSRGSMRLQRYQTRSVASIIDELHDIGQQGYHHIAIVDDCFPANTKYAHELLDAIIKEQLSLKFSVTAARVDLADRELYEKMRQAGVTHIQFGLESGNQDVLDFYHKHTTVATIRTAVHQSVQAGLFTTGSFIFGAPFETQQHFNTTLSFAQSLPLHSVSFLPLRYMIGSALWQHAVAEGKIKATEYTVVADKKRGLGRFTQEELMRYCASAQRAFYLRPAFVHTLLKTSLRNSDMTFIHSYLSVLFSSFKKNGALKEQGGEKSGP